MSRIFYSMCGEGRGHAVRVRSMVEQLKHEHELVLFAPDQAYDFLAPLYPAGTPNVEVRRIPGLRFHYAGNRLNFLKTAYHSLGFLWKLPGLISDLKRCIKRERPDLIISDFEPALPRAARRMKVPFLSLNHQHFLVGCDLSTLPPHLQTWANMMSMAVRAHHRGQLRTIVSSFFHANLKPGYDKFVQVGPLLRRDVERATPSDRGHLVSYLRPATPPYVIEYLKGLDREVLVYGLGQRPDDGPLKFRPLHEQRFVDDVASCSALIGAAGNQTLGEAIYLGKPVFALPEEDHHEQLINSHFLAQMGTGDFQPIEHVERKHFHRFMDRLDDFRGRLADYVGRINGTPTALAEVRRYLPAARSLAM